MENDCKVKSGARAIRILEFFHRHRAPARAIEIVRQLGLAPSTTSDLLKTLVEEGYLDFDPDTKCYFIAMRAALFGGWASSLYPNIGQLDDLLNRLREETRETIVLSTQRGNKVQFLRVLNGPDFATPRVAEGLAGPLFGTAAGGAILMQQPREEIAKVVRRTYRLKADREIVESIYQKVNEFKARGYASPTRKDFLPGSWTLAIPVPKTLAGRPVVLGLGGPYERVKSAEQELFTFASSRLAAAAGIAARGN